MWGAENLLSFHFLPWQLPVSKHLWLLATINLKINKNELLWSKNTFLSKMPCHFIWIGCSVPAMCVNLVNSSLLCLSLFLILFPQNVQFPFCLKSHLHSLTTYNTTNWCYLMDWTSPTLSLSKHCLVGLLKCAKSLLFHFTLHIVVGNVNY